MTGIIIDITGDQFRYDSNFFTLMSLFMLERKMIFIGCLK